MLALHRSARSDLFFEGVVTESGPSSFCKVRFTEGRAKGQSIKVHMPEKEKSCACPSAYFSLSLACIAVLLLPDLALLGAMMV